MKFTEGGFRSWGYALAERAFGERVFTWEEWERLKKARGEDVANLEQKAALAAGRLLVKDAIADITLQQVLTRPEEFDVIATLNLNGDYLSDALAAQVGGIGIAPGGNINYISGHAVFEATHGTAPKYADQDKVNPGSVILSGEMMLRYMGWTEAADLIIRGLDGAISSRTVTYDLARLMDGAREVAVQRVRHGHHRAHGLRRALPPRLTRYQGLDAATTPRSTPHAQRIGRSTVARCTPTGSRRRGG